MTELLFVYGVLVPEALSRAGQPAMIRGRMYDNGMAAVVPGKDPSGRDAIRGVVFRVCAEDLRRYDALEDVGHHWSMYARERVTVFGTGLASLDGMQAWCYVAAGNRRVSPEDRVEPCAAGYIVWRPNRERLMPGACGGCREAAAGKCDRAGAAQVVLPCDFAESPWEDGLACPVRSCTAGPGGNVNEYICGGCPARAVDGRLVNIDAETEQVEAIEGEAM
jgi:gamma-glutamylcyclotransferase (GGCT)/AIG2-like uncharacterized protein YtfP